MPRDVRVAAVALHESCATLRLSDKMHSAAQQRVRRIVCKVAALFGKCVNQLKSGRLRPYPSSLDHKLRANPPQIHSVI
jgi:hypothetical protein